MTRDRYGPPDASGRRWATPEPGVQPELTAVKFDVDCWRVERLTEWLDRWGGYNCGSESVDTEVFADRVDAEAHMRLHLRLEGLK